MSMLAPPSLGTDVAGYRLESMIARGGMAVVYRADHARLGRKVAIKILTPELAEDERFRERFVRESRIAAGIEHPNVIPIHDAGEAAGHLFIAMQLVEDTDLRTLIRLEAPLPVERTVSIVTQVAGALAEAHERGLVHRDVKPANVLLVRRRSETAADHAYLTDFGLAKRTSSVSGLTATGQFLGTVSYISPEQVEGKPVDARADIYALGCVLFECLTGRPPFEKEEEVAVVMAHLTEPPPRLEQYRPDCPEALGDVIEKALSKAPEARQQSCDELIDELRAAVAGDHSAVTVTRPSRRRGAAEPPAPGAPKGSGGFGRWRWLLALAAAAAVAVAVVLITGGNEEGDGGGAVSPAAAPAPATQGGSAPQTAAAWRPVADSPTARQAASTATSGEVVWLFGGLTGSAAGEVAATAKVEAYDAAIDGWTTGPDLPIRLHHSMAAQFDDRHVVLGGWTPGGPDLTAVTSDRVFTLDGDTWEKLPKLNEPRAAGAAVAVGDQIVVTGGVGADGELIETTEVFDGEAWREVARIPTPREHLAAASDGEFFYAVGGREFSSDRNVDALERYDPATDEWTKLPSMPTPAGGLGAAIVEGNLVAVGGEEPTGALGDVLAFDLATERWSELPPLRSPRHGAAVTAVGQTVYALDGALSPTHVESTSTGEALDFK